MRALRVIGLDEDGKSVILEDPENRGERFTLPADERLRAALRGDLARLGQMQIESGEAQMRPREIQARIRSGESIEQVAAASGMPAHRIERFAYPVLLERSRTADMAQRAHPVREDGPDVQTLGEVVAHSFGLRGHDLSDTSWDSWKGDDGRWIVQLHWKTGRSDNRAHWAFHPGAQGGTVTALDDAAVDLMDPNPNRTLRTVRPVTQLARQALEATPVLPPIPLDEEPLPVPAQASAPVAAPAVAEKPVQEKLPEPEPAPAPPPPPVKKEQEPAAEKPVRKDPPPKRGKKNHPIVPSWEDVLLGVRSNR
ncbi:septation protein SepH [Lentzea sp. BCCO 10_0798]|uniref:Septation protein SepH n=1 Tax=Lentzea kristufekii TaxID=3095430 RepID=A0ABU4TS87_9PSEU|nr:septation protein SepH [Lentzea sp. BCCO 10_0798]MDX8051154.1 septation protein SepH [Lentzea sp. BCCO 10_0798]